MAVEVPRCTYQMSIGSWYCGAWASSAPASIALAYTRRTSSVTSATLEDADGASGVTPGLRGDEQENRRVTVADDLRFFDVAVVLARRTFIPRASE